MSVDIVAQSVVADQIRSHRRYSQKSKKKFQSIHIYTAEIQYVNVGLVISTKLNMESYGNFRKEQ